MRAAPLIAVLLLAGPVLAGLAGTIAPAFGYFPAIGGDAFTLSHFKTVFDWAGIGPSIRLSLTTGFAATALSLIITTLLLAGWWGSRSFRWMERALSPLLSVPHAAAAFGIAFLIAPSGLIARLFSPWLTGWTRPPDLLIVNDPFGLAMIAGLVAKEVPFLLLMSLAALPQCAPDRSIRVTSALGYGRVTGFLWAVFPQLYRRIRLPVFAVLAYSMTVVDVAIILGPNTPPPLSVQVVRWMSDPDLSQRFVAAAGATVQTALVILALALWRMGEAFAKPRSIPRGIRSHWDNTLRGLGGGLAVLSGGLIIAGLSTLALWSVAGRWQFPKAWPDSLSLRHWDRNGANLSDLIADTGLVALTSTFIALALCLLTLEADHRRHRPLRGLGLLYLPLIVPQIAFLPGLQSLALTAGIGAGAGPVILAHTIFVLPYVYLSLNGPFHGWDTRFATTGATMGASPWRVFVTLRLPMLFAPILTASAVGFAVSVGQYLPTLLIGGGRVQTLTTEAVALAAGGDRRVIGVYAIAQTLVVIAGFALAIAAPRLVWANRRGLRGMA